MKYVAYETLRHFIKCDDAGDGCNAQAIVFRRWKFIPDGRVSARCAKHDPMAHGYDVMDATEDEYYVAVCSRILKS